MTFKSLERKKSEKITERVINEWMYGRVTYEIEIIVLHKDSITSHYSGCLIIHEMVDGWRNWGRTHYCTTLFLSAAVQRSSKAKHCCSWRNFASVLLNHFVYCYISTASISLLLRSFWSVNFQSFSAISFQIWDVKFIK